MGLTREQVEMWRDDLCRRYGTAAIPLCDLALKGLQVEAMLEELERLRKIEHLAWHACESAEEGAEDGEFSVTAEDFRALCEAVPQEHPVMNRNPPPPASVYLEVA